MLIDCWIVFVNNEFLKGIYFCIFAKDDKTNCNEDNDLFADRDSLRLRSVKGKDLFFSELARSTN